MCHSNSTYTTDTALKTEKKESKLDAFSDKVLPVNQLYHLQKLTSGIVAFCVVTACAGCNYVIRQVASRAVNAVDTVVGIINCYRPIRGSCNPCWWSTAVIAITIKQTFRMFICQTPH